MNERILELAEQASNTTTSYYDGRGNVTQTVFDKEKFAELIVKECVSIVEGVSPGYEDYRNQIEDAFRRDCVESIKHKFGVEE